MSRWFAQEHPASCVAACVRMVLTVFGQERSEVEIRQILGNPRSGVTLRAATEKLIAAGALAQWHDDWGMDDLRDSLRDGDFPIAGVERRFFGHPSASHAVVITGIKNAMVEMLDPLIEQVQITQIQTFTQAWHSAGQEALILRSALLPDPVKTFLI